MVQAENPVIEDLKEEIDELKAGITALQAENASQNGSITDLNNRVTALEQPGFLTVNCDTPDSDLQSAINDAPEGTVDARAFRQTLSRFTAANRRAACERRTAAGLDAAARTGGPQCRQVDVGSVDMGAAALE